MDKKKKLSFSVTFLLVTVLLFFSAVGFLFQNVQKNVECSKIVDNYFINKACLDACPSQRKVVRLSNGTMFTTYYTRELDWGFYVGTVKISRSIDNGKTWVQFSDRCDIIGNYGNYDPCLVVDGNDNLYFAFARGTGASQGLQYKIWNKTTGWSVLYNLTREKATEDVVMVVNKSDAVYFFWYDNQTNPPMFNERFCYLYKGEISEIYNITTLSNTSSMFLSGTVDSNDIIHLTWFEDIMRCIDYVNITGENTVGHIRHIQNPGFAFLQTAPCITSDLNNNIQISWVGLFDGSGYDRYIRFIEFCQKNNTWTNIMNVSVITTDYLTYPYPSTTVDQDNVYYIVFGGVDGEHYISRKNEVWSEITKITNNFLTTNNHVLYARHPFWMMNKNGFSVIYWNSTGTIDYFDMNGVDVCG